MGVVVLVLAGVAVCVAVCDTVGLAVKVTLRVGVEESVGKGLMLGVAVAVGAASQRTSAARSAAVSASSTFASAPLHVLPSKGAATTAVRSRVLLSSPSQSASPGLACAARSGLETHSCPSAAISRSPVVTRPMAFTAAAYRATCPI